MNNKLVIAIFSVAALAVISGFFYFGSALNQQASVGNLLDKKITLPVVVSEKNTPRESVDEEIQKGIFTKLVSAEAIKSQTISGDNNDEVTFTTLVQIDNYSDDDMYLDRTCTSLSRKQNTLGTKDLTVVVEDANKIIPLGLVAACSIISDRGVIFPEAIKIPQGASDVITVTVSTKPSATGSYRMRIAGIGYNTVSGDLEGNQLLSAGDKTLSNLATNFVFAN